MGAIAEVSSRLPVTRTAPAADPAPFRDRCGAPSTSSYRVHIFLDNLAQSQAPEPTVMSMRNALLRSALLLAVALPVEALAAPRAWQRAPVDPFEDEYEYVERDNGDIFDMLMGGPPRRYRPVPVDPYTGLPLGPGARRAGRGALSALPPSYAFEPEYEGLGMAVDPKYDRQIVRYAGPHALGTIVIDKPAKFL